MSEARPVVPGRVVVVSRRCLERRFFLLPQRKIMLAFGFLMALAAKQFGLGVVAVTQMSGHYHAVLVDVEGRLPAFFEWLHSQVAKLVNWGRGRKGKFWDGAQTNVVEIEESDPDTMLAKIAYVLGNPVAAGAVERGRDWPGLRTTPQMYTKSVRFERPDWFYGKASSLPEAVELKCVVPPTHPSTTPAAFGRLVERAVADYEEGLRKEARAAKRGFEGVRRVLGRSWDKAPTTEEGRGELRPEVAGSTKEIRRALLEKLRAFRKAYKEALTAFNDGARDVVFPAGTWWMWRRHKVNVAVAAPS